MYALVFITEWCGAISKKKKVVGLLLPALSVHVEVQNVWTFSLTTAIGGCQDFMLKQ